MYKGHGNFYSVQQLYFQTKSVFGRDTSLTPPKLRNLGKKSGEPLQCHTSNAVTYQVPNAHLDGTGRKNGFHTGTTNILSKRLDTEGEEDQRIYPVRRSSAQTWETGESFLFLPS